MPLHYNGYCTIIYGHSISTTARVRISLINMNVQTHTQIDRQRQAHTRHTTNCPTKIKNRIHLDACIAFDTLRVLCTVVYMCYLFVLCFFLLLALRLSRRVVHVSLTNVAPYEMDRSCSSSSGWFQPCHLRCRRQHSSSMWALRIARGVAATQSRDDPSTVLFTALFIYDYHIIWMHERHGRCVTFVSGTEQTAAAVGPAATRHHQQHQLAASQRWCSSVEHMAMIECCTQFPLAFQSPSQSPLQCAARARESEWERHWRAFAPFDGNGMQKCFMRRLFNKQSVYCPLDEYTHMPQQPKNTKRTRTQE